MNKLKKSRRIAIKLLELLHENGLIISEGRMWNKLEDYLSNYIEDLLEEGGN
jgi:hypothetical protein